MNEFRSEEMPEETTGSEAGVILEIHEDGTEPVDAGEWVECEEVFSVSLSRKKGSNEKGKVRITGPAHIKTFVVNHITTCIEEGMSPEEIENSVDDFLAEYYTAGAL